MGPFFCKLRTTRRIILRWRFWSGSGLQKLSDIVALLALFFTSRVGLAAQMSRIIINRIESNQSSIKSNDGIVMLSVAGLGRVAGVPLTRWKSTGSTLHPWQCWGQRQRLSNCCLLEPGHIWTLQPPGNGSVPCLADPFFLRMTPGWLDDKWQVTTLEMMKKKVDRDRHRHAVMQQPMHQLN